MVTPDGWVRDGMRAKNREVGRTLLHHAAWVGNLPVFKLLVESGGDVNKKRNTAWRPNGGVNGRGSTPLHAAVMYNRENIVKYLVEDCGVDIDIPGEQGYTILHIACKFNLPNLTEYLLSRGARTDLLTRDEKTARELAGGRQDRSHAQQGEMLAAFDKFDAESKTRKKLLPGAPRPDWNPEQNAIVSTKIQNQKNNLFEDKNDSARKSSLVKMAINNLIS